MSIQFYFSVFLFLSTILLNINAQNPLQTYVIHRDLLTGVKAGEFTVYDSKEKHVYYRLESNYALLSSLNIVAYPSKQTVGKLERKIKPFVYKGEFSILDPQSNQWVKGTIEQKFRLDRDLFYIQWGKYRISMTKEFATFTNKFHDTDGGELLATLRVRPASVFWRRKYDMQIFSNKYPEQIYLLGLLARDSKASGK